MTMSMVRQHLQLVLFLVSLASARLAFSQTVDLTVDIDHLNGVLAAHRANLDAWNSADVVFRFKQSGSGRLTNKEGYVAGPDAMSVVHESEYVCRFSFDRERQLFRVVKRKSGEIQVFDSLDQPVTDPKRTWSESAGIVDRDASVQLAKERGQLYEMQGDVDFEKFVAAFSIPTLTLCGLGLGEGQDWADERIDSHFDRFSAQDLIRSVSNVGRDRYRIETIGKNSMFVQLDLDISRMVPVRVANYRRRPDGSADQLLFVRNCDWKPVGKMFLPIRDRGKSMSWLYEEGLSFVVDYETEFDAHWYSFNEELPAEMFDPEQLRSVTVLNELLSEKPLEDDSKKDPTGGER